MKNNKVLISLFMILSLVAVYPNRNLLLLVPPVYKLTFRCIFIFVLCIIYIRKILITKRVDCLLTTALIFSLIQLIVTIVHNEDIVAACYSGGVLVIGALLISKCFIDIDNATYFNTAYYYFLIMCIINIITGFFPENKIFDQYWFFGNRNKVFLYYFPLIIFEYLLSMNDEYSTWFNKILFANLSLRRILTYALIFYNIILGGSMTSFCSLFLLTVYIIFFSKKNIYIFSIFNYIIIYIFMLCTLVLPGTNSVLLKHISKLLGKGDSASARSYIYDNVINKILSGNYFFGSGLLKTENFIGITLIRNFDQKTKKYVEVGFNNSHNLFLETMLQNGIVGVFIICVEFFLVIILAFKNKFEIKNIVYIALFSILVESLFESIIPCCLLFLLGILHYPFGEIAFDIKTNEIVLNILNNK